MHFREVTHGNFCGAFAVLFKVASCEGFRLYINVNMALSLVSKWFTENNLVLNGKKTNRVRFSLSK